jgi:hypothetical protein
MPTLVGRGSRKTADRKQGREGVVDISHAVPTDAPSRGRGQATARRMYRPDNSDRVVQLGSPGESR